MIYAVSLLVVVCAVQGWLLWRLVRSMGSLGRMEERLTRCTQGLALLVDTSESGFTLISNELGRLSSSSRRPVNGKVATRRIVAAASRGSSVADIAANVGVSEGEARLRMLLRNGGVSAVAAEDGHDSLRA
ncbi:MAG: hypothetical protein WCP29_11690 [Acidobacteriota bacterium]